MLFCFSSGHSSNKKRTRTKHIIVLGSFAPFAVLCLILLSVHSFQKSTVQLPTASGDIIGRFSFVEFRLCRAAGELSHRLRRKLSRTEIVLNDGYAPLAVPRKAEC